MATALQVARLLIGLSGEGGAEDSDPLTPMRLQKLLYYAQGWALASLRRPLFRERIEAWAHGPVVMEVYQTFKPYRSGVIPADEGTDGLELSVADREMVKSVWQRYREYSAGGLRSMTHAEAPYQIARGNLPENARSSAEITCESMRAFFTEQAKPLLIPGIDPADVYAALEELEGGGGLSHEEVFTRLRGRQ